MVCPYDIDRIRERHGRLSIFDVDGYHTAEYVIHDLNVAMDLTAHGRIILVDDYVNPWWPGVHEGVVKFYITEPPLRSRTVSHEQADFDRHQSPRRLSRRRQRLFCGQSPRPNERDTAAWLGSNHGRAAKSEARL